MRAVLFTFVDLEFIFCRINKFLQSVSQSWSNSDFYKKYEFSRYLKYTYTVGLHVDIERATQGLNDNLFQKHIKIPLHSRIN